MNVSVIKKTKDLNRLTLAETVAIIKACDLDDKQREINHVNFYSTTNLGISSTNGFSSFTIPKSHVVPQTHTIPPTMPYQHSYQHPTSSSKAPITTSAPKEAEENMALASGVVNCYNAFIAGDLPHKISFVDLNQIHPEDAEEMEIN